MGAKLNATGAFEIRLAFQRGDSIRDIAARFNVSEATVWNVVNYETWQRVGPLRAPDWLPGERCRLGPAVDALEPDAVSGDERTVDRSAVA